MTLLLGVKRGNWREEEIHNDKVYLDARSKAIVRDHSTCQECSWQADRYQEGHHKDDDHTNNNPANIITLCAWCHRCHHIGLAGVYELGYVGISTDRIKPLPPQAFLNQATRFYDWICAHQNAKPMYVQWAYNFEEYLTNCIGAAERVFGSSELNDVAEILSSMSNEEYSKRESLFADVRLVHRRMQDLNPAKPPESMELERRKFWVSVMKQRLGSPT
ncbi:HNH endonuclease [Pseudomonas sp. GXZC]|uniref:HNH endonuclease n=1 Tax=Pseudomonas sp. GXZC TaxID=3003351 RepID=UPI0022AB3803|nr:HNH endonuclease [Pseudomonas sp. GXZC]WAT32105.1 hypothetical protein OZ428_34150 [Pseudomonas sp. GXZC]